MARFIKDRIKSKGQAPGSLVFIGKQKMDKPEIQLMQYDTDNLVEEQIQSVSDAYSKIQNKGVSWINIYGIHDLDMIKDIGSLFNLPPLLLEDLLNTDQHPKYEDGEDYDAFILKMLHFDEQLKQIKAEQITILLGEHYVLTLQEKRGDVFAPVRERIRKSKGRVRISHNDYLAYALMDTIVDNYIILIENLGRKVEDLEDRIFLKRDDTIIEEIYNYKTELNFLRKAVRPVKDVINSLMKSENSYFQDSNRHYLKDLYDLVSQSTDAIELYNNLISDQLNIYNANVSNRMNDIMKVLTIFASIFIPLTFIAGIYGMNFEHMPELTYKYSYPVFWLLIVSILLVLLSYFKRKKWL